MKIGLIAESQGEVGALEWACDLLTDEKGAGRVFSLGNRWADVNELFQRKREAARIRRADTNADFFADVASFSAAQASEGSPGARTFLELARPSRRGNKLTAR